MPKATVELTHDEYIKSLGLAPELEQKLFESLGVPEVWAKAKVGILRQSDYSRQMDEARTKQAELDALYADNEHWKSELESWHGKTQSEVEADKQRLAASELKIKEGEIRLRNAAREMGLTDEQIFGAQPTIQQQMMTPTPAVAAFDDSKYVSKEESAKYLRESVMLQADQLDMLDEHRSLFPDKPLKFKELVAEAISHRKTPSQWWEEKFNVAQVRTDRAAEANKVALEAARQEGYIAGRSERGQPSRSPQPSSALFQTDRTKRPSSSPSKDYLQKAIQDTWRRADARTKAEDDFYSN